MTRNRVLMFTGHSLLMFRGSVLAFCFFLSLLTVNAQTLTLKASANDGRPVDTIIGQIEKLSGIPISYEDLLYNNPADTIDIATSVLKGPVAGAHLIVPRGGALSVPITVDSLSQTLVGYFATANALSALMAAANSPSVSGTFKLDTYNNAFFLVPTHSRSANNGMTPFTAVLSTPIDLPGVQQSAFETLRAILNQVSQKAKVTVKMGTIPIKAFAVTQTNLAASSQPASYALARLFDAVATSGGAPPGLNGMSYHAFLDPVAKYYVLNIQTVQDPHARPAVPSSQPQPGVGFRLGTKVK